MYKAIFVTRFEGVRDLAEINNPQRVIFNRLKSMTTLVVDLIHPIRQETIQNWTFNASQTSIRIGRSCRNDITLSSRVVSRDHAMLHFDDRNWTLQSLGINGCYRNERLVKNPVVNDGDIFRIAKTGPRLRIRIEADASAADSLPPQHAPSLVTSPISPNSSLSQDGIVTARDITGAGGSFI